MAIKKPNELSFENKKIAMLISGRPGYWKTTTAMSAPNPLLIDIEDGVDRVEAIYRKDTLVIEPQVTYDKNGNKQEELMYDALMRDLTPTNLRGYDTLVIDTLGRLVEILAPVVISESSANGQKDGRTLSMKGYGAVLTKIKDFISYVWSMDKHIIFLVHETETKDGDIVKTRLDVAGSTRDKIWDDIDLGGHIEIQGKKHVICFTPTERYDAKGTHGVKGVYELPELKTAQNGGKSEDNHFLTDLFNTYLEDIQNQQKIFVQSKVKYEKAIAYANNFKEAADIEALNAAVESSKEVEHALTSKQELRQHMMDAAARLGAKYDKETGRFIKAE